MTTYIRFHKVRWLGTMVLLATAGLGSLIGQTIAQSESGSTSSSAGLRGLQLYNVTGWAGYYSVAQFASFASPRLPSDVALGTSATLGWAKSRERSSVSFTYTSSFVGRVRFTDASALNHSLSFFASRKITSRWSLDFSTFATLSTTDQLLFTPSPSGQLAAAPANFEELAAGMLRRQFTNPQLAALLTGTPLVYAVERPAILGDRAFSASAQVRLTYAPSSRTAFYVGLGGWRNQVLPNSDGERNRPAGVLSQSTTADVSVGLSHSLTPRTTVGLSASRSRTFSVFQDAYRDSFYGSVGRKMGRRWLVQGYGGTGRVQPIRSLYTLPTGPQYLAGASVAYKLSAHTFIASVDRNFGDSYGLGGQSTVSINGAWNWSPRGRDWTLFSSIGQYRMLGSPLGDLNSWRASTGLSRKISTRAALSTEYAYATSSSPFGLIPNFSQHAARVAVTWSPQWSPLR